MPSSTPRSDIFIRVPPGPARPAALSKPGKISPAWARRARRRDTGRPQTQTGWADEILHRHAPGTWTSARRLYIDERRDPGLIGEGFFPTAGRSRNPVRRTSPG